VLVDEALPDEEMDRIEAAIAAARTAEVAGYHKLRARRAGSRRYIDLHVQYRSGTSLERAHELAHGCATDRGGDPAAEVLIHVEPETSLRDRSRDRRALTARRDSARRREREAAAGRVHRGGEADGDHGDRVAGVAADREEDAAIAQTRRR
jgi:hypothetical protein